MLDGPETLVADLVSFIDASPTPWHAVAECVVRLNRAGYSALDERDAWRLEPGTAAYVVRGGATLAAFRIGLRPPSEAGFLVLGAHTDSPCLRPKPRPDAPASGYLQLAVEVYGGVLLHSWLDRDLSISGRVALRGGRSELVRLDRVCRIPSLAIHLDRGVNTDGPRLNPQTQLRPLLSLAPPAAGGPTLERLLEAAMVAEGGAAGSILSHDLCLHDADPPARVGPERELLSAPRLDNLASCHAILTALVRAAPRDATQVVVLYDHEEVGSESARGAESRFLLSVLERIAAIGPNGGGPESVARAIARSYMVSVDMAHALHPSYAEKHDEQHQPMLGRGPVLKVNVAQRYASDGLSLAVFREACEAAGVEPQWFVSRNDLPCGTTIGPISAARTGIRTVDVGNPMLGMHSARETAAAADVAPMIDVLERLLSASELPTPSA